MPRKNLVRTDRLPYHVTARSNNREAFHIGLNLFWQILEEQCLYLHWIYRSEFHAIVLMPNHFHMLITVPEHDLGIVMDIFMSAVTKASNSISGRSGRVFGAPYHWSLIDSSRYFGHALKYVYRNPVRAGLCERVEDYKFSSLYGLVGRRRLPFPIHVTRVGMELGLPSIEPGNQIQWLNKNFPFGAEAKIKKGLKSKLFAPIFDPKTNTPDPQLSDLI